MPVGGKVALIFGISGQDGAYLAEQLLGHGIHVHGTSRDSLNNSFDKLVALGIRNRVQLHTVDPMDASAVRKLIDELHPHAIYQLACQSSVAMSFKQPLDAMLSTAVGTANILEAVRQIDPAIRIFSAGSSEAFGPLDEGDADETTPLRPRNPYGVGKAAAFGAVATYREAYGLFACTGILFNHESPLRPPGYVTRKIICGAADIHHGKTDTLHLGNLDITRDWGWAPDYVDAMQRMLDLDRPEDFVIATGIGVSLRDFVANAFSFFGLDWRAHVQITPGLIRPTDSARSVGNPAKARDILGWVAQTRMPHLVERMAEAELALRRQNT